MSIVTVVQQKIREHKEESWEDNAPAFIITIFSSFSSGRSNYSCLQTLLLLQPAQRLLLPPPRCLVG